jgi:hypothetical protein
VPASEGSRLEGNGGDCLQGTCGRRFVKQSVVRPLAGFPHTEGAINDHSRSDHRWITLRRNSLNSNQQCDGAHCQKETQMSSEDELELVAEPEEEEEYIQYDIATYPSDYTLSGIQELWNANDLIIPEFQREFVWSIEQASLLIDSFLMGLPVPPVFFISM